jgi:hypothetical protein
MYQYLVIPKRSKPFFTHWCNENLFPISGGIAFDLINHLQTTNGSDWVDVELDHL